MSPEGAIRRVERYRDDIVTHGETARAMTLVCEAARAAWLREAENRELLELIHGTDE